MPNSGRSARGAVMALAATAVIALGQGAVTAGPALEASPAGCHGRWIVVPSPNAGRGSNVLTGVWAAASDDVWATGWYGDPNLHTPETLAEHWDGGTWSLVPMPVPGPGPGGNFLYGISGASSDDVWAVGDYGTGLPLLLSLIEHWDGTQWSVVPSPNVGTSNNILEAVSAISPTDAWAVGFYTNESGDHDLTLHWDGTAWNVVPGARRTDDPILYGVSFLSADDGWAVGVHDGAEQSSFETLFEHWDGTAWTRVDGPSPGFQNYLFGVATAPADGVLSVGLASPSLGRIRTLAERWDGQSWTRTPTPSPGTSYNSLAGVWADPSSGQAWAAGSYYDAPTSEYRTLTESWDGASWTAVLSPNPGSISDELLSVSGTSSSDVWAVGRLIDDHPYRTLIEHFC